MKFAAFKDLTRLEFSLFALPYTLAGALLPIAAGASVENPVNWLWILPAFMMARISGMAFNQLIDRYIDAQNERTKNRPIPSGRVTPKQAAIVAWSSLLAFVVICYQINFLCFLIAPLAAFLIFIYSYMKRIHASCHFVLGCIQFLGPVMAYIAIAGTCGLAPIFLGLAALFTTSGNDIAYAIQDVMFDREQDLYSIPAKLGILRSLSLAKSMHIGAVGAFLCVGIFGHLSVLYYFSIPVMGAVFFCFHKELHAQYRRTASVGKVERAFFLSNVIVSLAALGGILLSVVWRVL